MQLFLSECDGCRASARGGLSIQSLVVPWPFDAAPHPVERRLGEDRSGGGNDGFGRATIGSRYSSSIRTCLPATATHCVNGTGEREDAEAAAPAIGRTSSNVEGSWWPPAWAPARESATIAGSNGAVTSLAGAAGVTAVEAVSTGALAGADWRTGLTGAELAMVGLTVCVACGVGIAATGARASAVASVAGAATGACSGGNGSSATIGAGSAATGATSCASVGVERRAVAAAIAARPERFNMALYINQPNREPAVRMRISRSEPRIAMNSWQSAHTRSFARNGASALSV